MKFFNEQLGGRTHTIYFTYLLPKRQNSIDPSKRPATYLDCNNCSAILSYFSFCENLIFPLSRQTKENIFQIDILSFLSIAIHLFQLERMGCSYKLPGVSKLCIQTLIKNENRSCLDQKNADLVISKLK